MPIKLYKTTRGARKQASIVDRRELRGTRPHRPLTLAKRRGSGRGAAGKITVRHRGGGAKRLQRVVDFGQAKLGVTAVVESLEYDPNRTGFIVLLKYEDGDRRYRLAWEGATIGQRVVADVAAPEEVGNRLPLKKVTPGTNVYEVELKVGRGAKLLRAAGATAVVMDVSDGLAQLK